MSGTVVKPVVDEAIAKVDETTKKALEAVGAVEVAAKGIVDYGETFVDKTADELMVEAEVTRQHFMAVIRAIADTADAPLP